MSHQLKEHQINNTFICNDANKSAEVLKKATDDAHNAHSNLCLIEVELPLPSGVVTLDSEVLWGFALCFQETINKQRKGLKHKCNTRYFWEMGLNRGYKLTLILNRDAYPNISNYSSCISKTSDNIESSWITALGCTRGMLDGGITYPVNAVSFIRRASC